MLKFKYLNHFSIIYTFRESSYNPAEKMKFSIKHFFSKCDQICRKLRIWSHLLQKSLMENFIFCAMRVFEECFEDSQYVLPLSDITQMFLIGKNGKAEILNIS